MPRKPTADDARLILELYNLRREPEMRKARQWWLTTFWPENADDFMKVRPFLKELREKAKNPDLFLLSEKAILGSKLGRAHFAKIEPRVAMLRQQRQKAGA